MDTSSNKFWKEQTNCHSFELRSYRFRPEMLPIFYTYLGIKPDSNVLDAGAGSGVFTRYLAGGLDTGHITGFDINRSFLADGKQRLKEQGLEEKITLEENDGFHLSYTNDLFDAVTNYTYLGVLSDPMAGLKELIRVCKPGGMVSCVIATNQIARAFWFGDYPFEGADELQRLSVLENKIFSKVICVSSDPQKKREWGEFRYPKLFDICGLKHIHLYPIGYSICYDDDNLPDAYRKALIMEETKEQIEWLEYRYAGKEELYSQNGFTKENYDTLRSLLIKKQSYLQEHFETDRSYEWAGGFNFIVTGIK